MSTPTLPGTLPGLLTPGAPVAYLYADGTLSGGRGWVTERAWVHRGPDEVTCLRQKDHEAESWPLSRLALDLSRPEGVDRALRWLEAQPDGSQRLVDRAYHKILRYREIPAVYALPDEARDVEYLRLACLAAGGTE